MTSNLKSVGISEPEKIERYTLRSEAENDILKVYFRKTRGELFQRSVKLKFPRQRKQVLVDGGRNRYADTSEISPMLVRLLEELDKTADKVTESTDTKTRILKDLRHLEQVVAHKIKEIENELDKL